MIYLLYVLFQGKHKGKTIAQIEMTKNQEYKQSGSQLSYADWLRDNLNNAVQKTVANLDRKDGYLNVCGSGCCVGNTYKNYTTGSVLGVNQYVIYGGVVIVLGLITYGIFHHNKQNNLKNS